MKVLENNDTSEDNIQDIELIDIEDIVPKGGNSLFLSCARAILYMSNKNPMFISALQSCCKIDLRVVRTDIDLQSLLRQRLCEYFCSNGIVCDKTKGEFYLRDEYAKYFNNNLYDFLIQVYQLSINNFCNNTLYKKYALISLCQLLNIKIYFKRTNGQWKMYEPFTNKYNEKNLRKIVNEEYFQKLSENREEVDYLNQCIIYLQEFKSDSLSQLSTSGHAYSRKFIRILLNKKLWVSKHTDNAKICMKFSQFNDEREMKDYQRAYFTIDPKTIIDVFSTKKGQLYSQLSEPFIDLNKKLFCVLIHFIPVWVLLNADYVPRSQSKQLFYEIKSNHMEEFEANEEYSTLGKQFARFIEIGPDKTYQFLNYLWGKNVFNQEFVLHKYSLIISG